MIPSPVSPNGQHDRPYIQDGVNVCSKDREPAHQKTYSQPASENAQVAPPKDRSRAASGPGTLRSVRAAVPNERAPTVNTRALDGHQPTERSRAA